MNLAEYVQKVVDPASYYAKLLGVDTQGKAEIRVPCLFHQDRKNPNLNINVKNGKFHCFACEAKGSGIVQFEALVSNVPQNKAALRLFRKFIHKTIPKKQVLEWADQLKTSKFAKQALLSRGIPIAVASKLNIGFNGYRLTFPVVNRFGLVVNAKLWGPGKDPKWISYKNPAKPDCKYGSPPMLWPGNLINKLTGRHRIYVCEGEIDTLTLLSLGLVAVTSTGGCGNWARTCSDLFAGHEVVICYDNDDAGKDGARKTVQELKNVAQNIRVLKIPAKYGKDVNDWFLTQETMQTAEGWEHAADSASIVIDNAGRSLTSDSTPEISLFNAGKPEYINTPVKIKLHVVSRIQQPFVAPATVRFTLKRRCSNDGCKAFPLGKTSKDVRVPLTDARLLQFIERPSHIIHASLKHYFGFDCPDCDITAEVINSAIVDLAIVSPVEDNSSTDIESAGEQIRRYAYLVNGEATINRSYECTGLSIPHPRDQSLVHVFSNMAPLQDRIESFEVTKEVIESCQKFQVPAQLTPMAQLFRIAEWQRKYITGIRERPDLHIAVDLAYHSVKQVQLPNERPEKGMLDILIIGDTACGKGKVAEGLQKFYNLGAIASGENCTKVGLTGGVERGINGKSFIRWGILPMNHGKLVVIDELSSLTREDIGTLSRVRSEGVVEITKIERDKAPALTRLIWISNPRQGKQISHFANGVEAITDLIGAAEDIRRFDFAIVVAKNEIDPTLLNSEEAISQAEFRKYKPVDFRNLVMWAWSRTKDQIVLDRDEYTLLLEQSIKLSKQFSSQLPLIQAENIRMKLLRISAAIAARLFSTDESFTKVVIDVAHILCAVELLKLWYSKPCFGYLQQSKHPGYTDEVEATAIKAIEDFILRCKDSDRTAILDGLQQTQRITSDTLGDFTGDFMRGRVMLQLLLRHHLIMKNNTTNSYEKTVPFSTWIKAQLAETGSILPTMRQKQKSSKGRLTRVW